MRERAGGEGDRLLAAHARRGAAGDDPLAPRHRPGAPAEWSCNLRGRAGARSRVSLDRGELAFTENHPSWTHMYLMMMVAQIGFALAYVL